MCKHCGHPIGYHWQEGQRCSCKGCDCPGYESVDEASIGHQSWVAAGIALARDPMAAVICPECQDSNLAVLDVPHQAGAAIFDRYLTCPACGARSVVNRMKT